jgi:3-methylcrotonyl-CoA carboxylase alpha subunit
VTKNLLIANRGEIACRVMRSARARGLGCVAVYSDADRDALHVALADRSSHIGGPRPADSYLDVDAVLAAAAAHDCHAVHPGYGFLAENAGFAQRVIDAGLIWIGPDPDSIAAMGDKERARGIAAAAGVPVTPGSPRFAPGDLSGLAEAAARVGYPLLVKAAAGGGGIGMRLVEDPARLEEVAVATQGMAARAFGDGTVYLEKYIADARHIEVQVFGFGDGTAIHLYERECSIQRRFQKVIEEAPAVNLPAATRDAMADAAVALAQAQRYSGAGTVEFILDARTGEFYFLEMNTRIQVEHAVTEMITGCDLVGMQIAHALGDPVARVPQSAIALAGHAIECRLYAENPSKMFLPSPGKLERFELPAAEPGRVRLDVGMCAGDVVTPWYDPTLAKLICRGGTRDEALAVAAEALAGVHIEGIASNTGFLRRVVAHPQFKAGRITTAFVERYREELVN